MPCWQCPLGGEAREYITFATRDGIFTPARVPQGVMTGTSYFPGLLRVVLEDLVGRACLIYLDDVKFIKRSVEDLVVNLSAVLLRLIERGLFLAAHKFVLLATEVKWCGTLCSGTPVRYEPQCVCGLVEMRRPQTVGELMQFIQANGLDVLVTTSPGEIVSPL